MDKPHPLAERWRREADLYERRGLANFAAMARSFAEELDEHETERALERLTLTQAAEESGFSMSQLSRGIANGDLENVGAKYTPLIRRKDLPKKARKAEKSKSPSSPDLVAAALSATK